LLSYLIYYDRKGKSLATVRKNILNAVLKILRFEGKKDEKHSRN